MCETDTNEGQIQSSSQSVFDPVALRETIDIMIKAQTPKKFGYINMSKKIDTSKVVGYVDFIVVDPNKNRLYSWLPLA